MWIAEKIYYQGSSGYTKAYQGSELLWVIDIPLQSISISGETTVYKNDNTTTYSVNYTPSNTTETGVTWGIDGGIGVGVVTGNTYATINSITGELTVLSSATTPTPVTIIATSTANSGITDTLDISVRYYQSIDNTKKYWMNSNYNTTFVLKTRLNNNYRLEVDQYFTASAITGNAGSMLGYTRSPFEVFYTSGYYYDLHYPNSTADTTTNTSDYDTRTYINRSGFNTQITPNTQYTFKYYTTPTHYFAIYRNGSVIYTSSKNSVGNKNYCTSKDYQIVLGTCASRSKWLYVSDVRVYDDNNTLIHNFKLYPYGDSYAYYDTVNSQWTLKYGGTFTDIMITNR